MDFPRRLAVALLFALVTAAPSPASQDSILERAVADVTLTNLMERAASGDALAQYRLGSAYSLGEGGMERDDELAVYWWRKAAAQGSALAQNELGTAYAEGAGVEKDPREAVYWLTQAAEQGLAVAQANLATMYRHGGGVRKNDRRAAELYRRAADQGLGWAQFFLGEAYEAGVGVRKDMEQAASWYRKAADQHYSRAMHRLGLLYRRSSYTLPTVDSAVRENYGEYWVNRAALDGLEEAENYLDLMFSGTCAKRLRSATGAVRVAPDAAADVEVEVNREPACLLPVPGRSSRQLPGWEAVYLNESRVVGFMREDDLKPLF